MINIYLDATTTASMYVYSGDERRNSTWTIEGDAETTIGAPIRVPVNQKAMIVL